MDRVVWFLRFLRNMVVFLTPWIIRGVRAALWMIGMAFASFWVGAPNAVRTIAYNLTDQAHFRGVVDPYLTILYYALCVVVSVVIGICWVFTAFVTVWIVGLVV